MAHGARQGAYEPRVDGDALARGGLLELRLQPQRKPQREPGGTGLVDGCGRRGGLVVDVDDFGVAPRQPQLEVAGWKLLVRLEQRLAERRLEAERRGASDSVGQLSADLSGPGV